MVNVVVTHRELELRRKLEALRDGVVGAMESMLEAFSELQEREVALGERLEAARADVERLTRERDDACRERDEDHAARESVEGDLDLSMCARNYAEGKLEALLVGLYEVRTALWAADQEAPRGNVEMREVAVVEALAKLDELAGAARD